MTKVAVITDSHYGARNDGQVFLRNIEKFMGNIFFPTILERGIDTILHLGDLMDRRKFTNHVSLNSMLNTFMQPIVDNKLKVHLTLGNHDTTFKDTNHINTPRLFLSEYKNINIYEKPTEEYFGDLKMLLMPWIAEGYEQQAIKSIEATNARACMGHLELIGFEMNKGSIMTHGLQSSHFDKFEVVASGHYHHPSKRGNINYLGATGEFDWNDWDDPRGFHIFDTESLEFERILNPYTIFKKVYYNDTDRTLEDITADLTPDNFQDKYVKLIVTAKTNPFFYDMFVEGMEQAGVADVQVIDEYLTLDFLGTEDIVSQADDTPTLMRSYVDSTNFTLDKDILKRELEDIYREAIMNK